MNQGWQGQAAKSINERTNRRTTNERTHARTNENRQRTTSEPIPHSAMRRKDEGKTQKHTGVRVGTNTGDSCTTVQYSSGTLQSRRCVHVHAHGDSAPLLRKEDRPTDTNEVCKYFTVQYSMYESSTVPCAAARPSLHCAPLRNATLRCFCRAALCFAAVLCAEQRAPLCSALRSVAFRSARACRHLPSFLPSFLPHKTNERTNRTVMSVGQSLHSLTQSVTHSLNN